MIATPDIEQIIGAEAVDPNNDRVGKVSQVYVDADTDQPTWASVKTGLFGMSETLVPLDNATWDHEQLHITVEKARVKDAPRVDPDAEISPDEQERLYSYYGLMGATGSDAGRSGPIGAGRTDLDRDRIGSDVDGYDAATMSDTGYGAGAGAGLGADAGTGAGLAGSGVGRRHAGYDDGPSGPRFDRGQSAEADAPRRHTDAGYGEVSDEPGGPDVRASGRTAGDGRGSGDFASTGTALENDNPVAEEAAEGTGSGYGTSDVEDISGRFFGDSGVSGDTGGHRDRAEMVEAGAAPTDDVGMPGMAGGVAGGGMGGGQPSQGDPAMQTETGATDMPQGASGMPEGSVGMQRQAGGGMRLRRYVVRQETVVVPQDELRMEPGAGSSMDDSSTGMRMDDQDPTDPGRR
ncbi:PRC-barrel domain-containing protein [Amnibacterium sp.]|uniref:PRC-barrel domain-containing protein n=1 Tax=Amnibacterium sp. TaxID=1872496 RepID=UPI00260B2986|nr:PRC-barrel domain-containing protein [Amnibacterium sp.]MCU1472284.1 protein of unknown function DUF2382-like protein [Amnibacterium sp.]